MGEQQARLRGLPRVDEVLAHPEVAEVPAPRALAREAARQAIDEARDRLREGEEAGASLEQVARRAAGLLRARLRPSLRRCVNATGVILHTGLGRAPLSEAAREALARVAAGYCNVQADVGTGERMPREVHVEGLLCHLTGAEAAAVVNNNAAATVLVLNTLAAGREVVVSRGELVEIGGAFRLPEIIALSGCRLVEVGCTNRTHLRDYLQAIGPDTAALLVVHQSNYRIVGFASQPGLAEVAGLARERGILCVHDLGSGALLDLSAYGLPHEPTAPESLKAGADVVLFSGDKLLGGPQCGVVLGRRELVERMRRNPFYRTFRVDKLTLAALEATLRLFLDPETLGRHHPVMAALTAPVEVLRRRAEGLATRLQERCGDWLRVEVGEAQTEVGGGSLAGHALATVVVRARAAQTEAGALAARLRAGEPPVFARVEDDWVVMDLRTMLPGEEEMVVEAVEAARGPAAGG